MAVLMESVDPYITSLDDEPSLFLTNYTGHPSVVIPHGNGTSLIFVGRLFDEATILELAKAYQDQTTFHTGRPPGFMN
jgi:Asp-tRNA(Asn)/Glu-tRNA(Gln) amidotransferase A subunit family amidase